MTIKSLRKWVHLLFAVLLIATYPIAVLAQQTTAEPEIDDDENAVFAGIVEEIYETSLIVSSIMFDTATADFSDDEVEVGALVSIEFTIVEGNAVALRVALRGDDDDDDFDDFDDLGDDDDDDNDHTIIRSPLCWSVCWNRSKAR